MNKQDFTVYLPTFKTVNLIVLYLTFCIVGSAVLHAHGVPNPVPYLSFENLVSEKRDLPRVQGNFWGGETIRRLVSHSIDQHVKTCHSSIDSTRFEDVVPRSEWPDASMFVSTWKASDTYVHYQAQPSECAPTNFQFEGKDDYHWYYDGFDDYHGDTPVSELFVGAGEK